jgi:hypothetical protein
MHVLVDQLLLLREKFHPRLLVDIVRSLFLYLLSLSMVSVNGNGRFFYDMFGTQNFGCGEFDWGGAKSKASCQILQIEVEH